MNPYEAPKAGPPTLDFDELMRRDLRVIARHHKLVIVCIAANLLLIAMVFVAMLASIAEVVVVIRLVALVVTIVQLVAVGTLSSKLYGRGIAFFAVLGMFVPCFRWWSC